MFLPHVESELSTYISISSDRFANFRHFYDGLKSLKFHFAGNDELYDGSSVGEKRPPTMTSKILMSGLPIRRVHRYWKS